MADEYNKGGLSLTSTIAMGTGFMIGAGIFALTGQVAEMAGTWFPLAFVIGAIISAFSAYSYIKVSSAFPSSGGVAMILHKAYGSTTITGAAALLMTFSMIINESLVARTFGSYSTKALNIDSGSLWVPVLAVGLVVFAFRRCRTINTPFQVTRRPSSKAREGRMASHSTDEQRRWARCMGA